MLEEVIFNLTFPLFSDKIKQLGFPMKTAVRLITALAVFATSASAITTFVHPGAFESKEEIAFVKAEIKAGTAPRAAQFEAMRKRFAVPGAAVIPPLDNTNPDSKTNEDQKKEQAQRAYGNALAYQYTDNKVYADQAVAILKAWADVQPYVVYNGKLFQSMLDCAWMGSLLGPAAELVRGYMSPADLTIVTNMFKKVFVPSLSKMDPSNGNRDLTQINAMFSIAVFTEDAALFEAAKARLAYRMPGYVYLKTDGAKATSIPGADWYVPNFASPNSNGLMQESCRDWGHHVQFALATMLSSAEIAWHQGEDLYAVHKDRYIAAMELLAKQMNTKEMQGLCTDGKNTTTATVLSTFEIGYNHFHNVMGVPMSNTETVLTKIRATGESQWNVFYESLTHANIPNTNTGVSSIVGNSSTIQTSSSSSKANSSSSGNTTALNGLKSPWNMSVQGETLTLNAVSGTLVNVSITNLLGNQRKALFAGVASGNMNLAWGAGMPHGRYILAVQVGQESRHVLVSILGH
jgi:hypothetical protein